MKRVLLEAGVEDEIWEIWNYIAKSNPEAANHVDG
jgi:hypothetical protein